MAGWVSYSKMTDKEKEEYTKRAMQETEEKVNAFKPLKPFSTTHQDARRYGSGVKHSDLRLSD